MLSKVNMLNNSVLFLSVLDRRWKESALSMYKHACWAGVAVCNVTPLPRPQISFSRVEGWMQLDWQGVNGRWAVRGAEDGGGLFAQLLQHLQQQVRHVIRYHLGADEDTGEGGGLTPHSMILHLGKIQASVPALLHDVNDLSRQKERRTREGGVGRGGVGDAAVGPGAVRPQALLGQEWLRQLCPVLLLHLRGEPVRIAAANLVPTAVQQDLVLGSVAVGNYP